MPSKIVRQLKDPVFTTHTKMDFISKSKSRNRQLVSPTVRAEKQITFFSQNVIVHFQIRKRFIKVSGLISFSSLLV